MSVPNVRKRLNATTTTTAAAAAHNNNNNSNFLSTQPFKQLETIADPKSKSGFKTKIYPTKMNIERSSPDECFTKCEEKSQLICYKDNIKIISFKNDSRLTKYSTFDIDVAASDRRGKIVKYKSLDEPESKNMLKYFDPHSKVSISAQDFATDFKFSRIERKRNKHDIITETVDAWARKTTTTNNKSVFSNIKNTIFKTDNNKEIVFKPLVFGGTFPIDRPEMKIDDFQREKENSRMVMNESPKMREYGPPKTFNIDQPI